MPGGQLTRPSAPRCITSALRRLFPTERGSDSGTGTDGVVMAGTWQSSNAPRVPRGHGDPSHDGTVLVHDANRPSLGSTFGGATRTASRRTATATTAAAHGHPLSRWPLHSSSSLAACCADGRVFVVGGEFSDVKGASDNNQASLLRRIFDPVSNTWSAMTKPSSVDFIVGNCVVRPRRWPRTVGASSRRYRTAIWDPIRILGRRLARPSGRNRIPRSAPVTRRRGSSCGTATC